MATYTLMSVCLLLLAAPAATMEAQHSDEVSLMQATSFLKSHSQLSEARNRLHKQRLEIAMTQVAKALRSHIGRHAPANAGKVARGLLMREAKKLGAGAGAKLMRKYAKYAPEESLLYDPDDAMMEGALLDEEAQDADAQAPADGLVLDVARVPGHGMDQMPEVEIVGAPAGTMFEEQVEEAKDDEQAKEEVSDALNEAVNEMATEMEGLANVVGNKNAKEMLGSIFNAALKKASLAEEGEDLDQKTIDSDKLADNTVKTFTHGKGSNLNSMNDKILRQAPTLGKADNDAKKANMDSTNDGILEGSNLNSKHDKVRKADNDAKKANMDSTNDDILEGSVDESGKDKSLLDAIEGTLRKASDTTQMVEAALAESDNPEDATAAAELNGAGYMMRDTAKATDGESQLVQDALASDDPAQIAMAMEMMAATLKETQASKIFIEDALLKATSITIDSQSGKTGLDSIESTLNKAADEARMVEDILKEKGASSQNKPAPTILDASADTLKKAARTQKMIQYALDKDSWGRVQADAQMIEDALIQNPSTHPEKDIENTLQWAEDHAQHTEDMLDKIPSTHPEKEIEANINAPDAAMIEKILSQIPSTHPQADIENNIKRAGDEVDKVQAALDATADTRAADKDAAINQLYGSEDTVIRKAGQTADMADAALDATASSSRASGKSSARAKLYASIDSVLNKADATQAKVQKGLDEADARTALNAQSTQQEDDAEEADEAADAADAEEAADDADAETGVPCDQSDPEFDAALAAHEQDDGQGQFVPDDEDVLDDVLDSLIPEALGREAAEEIFGQEGQPDADAEDGDAAFMDGYMDGYTPDIKVGNMDPFDGKGPEIFDPAAPTTASSEQDKDKAIAKDAKNFKKAMDSIDEEGDDEASHYEKLSQEVDEQLNTLKKQDKIDADLADARSDKADSDADKADAAADKADAKVALEDKADADKADAQSAEKDMEDADADEEDADEAEASDLSAAAEEMATLPGN